MHADTPQHLLMIGIGAYVIKLWFDDFRAFRAGNQNPRALPGATSCSTALILLGILTGVALVAVETWGENLLGISEKQSNMTALFCFYTLLAGFVEEVIFRGYIVATKRGSLVLCVSAFLASALFAALHPFLWRWEGPWLPSQGGHIIWQLDAKGWFSTGAVFVSSLCFYALRFTRLNPRHSLLPAVAAHVAKNAGVIVVKGVQGHLVGWW